MQTGSNINQLDKDGNTPLQSLLIHLVQNRGNITDGHIKILETLVSHGAALHHKNNNGLSACDMAKALKGSLFGRENSCLQLLAQHRLQYDRLTKGHYLVGKTAAYNCLLSIGCSMIDSASYAPQALKISR